ncbi:putative M18 family aminopeptidase 2 [Tritrichomonas foetus]|uniref:aspartyl aminopeptidase n=1 Tax=Tritrichomonas foetus TaxID=1144522 RepID=A0A1J4KVR6_9EUKA|nr:putative M18 family aminopeptidase 2 [Tritrichomonas foetus]|eukprot:OHT13790.1 putative M18 family aminopeptidase 2 [Tritrichomonas foetus]
MGFGEELVQFINACPTPFQFAQVAAKILTEAGYKELHENEDWNDGDGIPKKGFVIREKRCLIAFNIGGYDTGIIVGTHCDSPVLRIDPKSEKVKGVFRTANCSTYGGGIWTTWLDRPLRLAGCIIKNDNSIVPFDSEEPIAIIPSLAVHLGKTTLEENNINCCSPIYGFKDSTSLKQYIAKKLNIEEHEIANFELSFVDANPPKIIGANKQFFASERIDNLSSTFAAIKAFLNSEPKNTLNILTVFDYEEVGSNTSTGAKGNFLSSVIKRLIPEPAEGENISVKQKYFAFIAKSLVVSSDNAHAVHPNYSSKHDPMHAPPMGSGVVIKKSPGVQYATDLVSSYPLKKAAEKSAVKLMYLINRNDIPSGSTIGPHVSTQLGIPTVDIGQPQLSMHSIREIVTVRDVEDNMKLLVELYNNYEEYRYKC